MNIDDLLSKYWDAAYTEGKEGRSHDTTDGAAQAALNNIREAFAELEKALEGYKEIARERAQFIINGEEFGYISLPESENDKAYLTFMRCKLTDEYAAKEALKEKDSD